MKEIEVLSGTKPCSKCKEHKPIACFNKSNDTKSGLSSACKDCLHITYLKKNPQDKVIPSLDGEVWLPIKGFIGLYEISNLGRVKSLKHVDMKGNVRKEYIFNNKDSYSKYHTVILCRGKERIIIGVHVLVATAFIPNPDNKPQPNHKNGIKYDNVATNLEWATVSENLLHAYRNGYISKVGVKNNQAKLTENQVLSIYNSSESGKEISKKYNVSISNVYFIKSGERWNALTKHLK